MAASKPISLSTYIKTFFISLNNNFGTLTLVLGCFPFDIHRSTFNPTLNKFGL